MKVSDDSMLGHTHTAVGIAAALAVVPPKSMPELLVGIGAGALGGLICDIDVGTSKSHKRADLITMFAAVIVAAVIAADYFFHVGIRDILMTNETFAQMFFPAVVFIGICAYGKGTHHRTFMHSLVGMVLLTTCIGVALPIAAPYFGIGFLSHIIIDLFNKKKVWLLWPSSKGVCFKLCSSKGLVNKILFYAGTFVSGICILVSIYNIYNLGQYISLFHFR